MALDDAAGIDVEALPATIATAGDWPRVPSIVRRNSRLLLAAEAFVGTGQQMVPTLGAIMVLRLTGSAALAGLGGSALGLTRVLASYPSGRLADAYGRKAILVAGLLLSLAGAVGLGSSLLLRSFPFFILALALFGIGNGASQQQRRLAAADMYPPELRARGLGFVLTGSLIGALGGPILISAAGWLAGAHGLDQVSMSWFLVPFVLVPSLVLILLIRPDPREIALRLERFYPGYRYTSTGKATEPAAGVSLWAFLRYYPHLVAFVCMFVLYANMSMMMALAPMTMSADGMTLSAISLTVAIHVMGMYAFSLPMGRMADAIGRRQVMYVGVSLSTIGTVLVALTAVYPLIVFGLFLIGLGWSCGNVSTAALVADTTPPQIRGSAMGANSSFSAAGSVSAPLLGGLLLARLGPGSLVAVTLVIIVPTLLLLARLHESRPGEYIHTSPW
jgi:MFS family permease